MSRTAVLKLAPVVLVAGLVLTASIEQAQAWWYAPAYPGRVYGYTVRPIYRRPLLRHWGYYHRPLVRWHHWRAYRHWPTVTYYAPVYRTSYIYPGYYGCCATVPPTVVYLDGHAPRWAPAEPRPPVPSNSEPPVENHEPELPPVRQPDPPPDPPENMEAAERSVYEEPVDEDPLDEEPLEAPDDDDPVEPPVLDDPLDEPPTLEFPQDEPALPFEPAPALPLVPDEARTSPAPPGATILAVEVPEDARVYVNGLPTRTMGSFRQYLSRGLQDGQEYTYEMRAEVDRDGQVLSETRAVTVQAGQRARVAFQLQTPEPAETQLTLRVPERARVTLEGRQTQAVGSQRQFVTQALAEGQVWSDYRVVVEIEEDGVVETREERLRLVGGRQHELAFDFDSPQIAAR